MKDDFRKRQLEKRALMVGKYISRECCTIRQASAALGIARSTLHKDIRDRLPFIDSSLYNVVDYILKDNKEEAPRRGGQSYSRNCRIRRQDRLSGIAK